MKNDLRGDIEGIKKLVGTWNDTDKNYVLDESIHCLFEKQVIKTPDAIAVVLGGEHLSYSELNCKANKLANFLIHSGLEVDDLVGVCLERSFEMVIALLGIIKAGGTYVPFDPEYPQERLNTMADDSCISILLTERKHLNKINISGLNSVCLDDEWSKVKEFSQESPESEVDEESLAYVI